MSTQKSNRQDQFGTEGIGEDGDADMGTRGHSSNAGTASTETGGTAGNDAGAQSRDGNPGNQGGTPASAPAPATGHTA